VYRVGVSEGGELEGVSDRRIGDTGSRGTGHRVGVGDDGPG